jgi:DNA primase
VNLLDLIGADGVKLKKYGATYRGRCPFHDGKTETSLLVDADAGKYHCFGCDMHGDAIQWLRERRGLSFLEACEYLGHDPGPRKEQPRTAPAAWEPREATAPAAIWQERARVFLDGAIDTLWSERGAKLRAWLRTEKGLHDATIKGACLGLNLADKSEPRATWGLDIQRKEDGTDKKQWLPAGLVIPWVVNGDVQRLRIRRNDPGDGPRYVIASGSSMTPAAWNLERGAAVIVESELDGLLLSQETGDFCAVVALGSATSKTNKESHDLLRAMPIILVSLDTDEAGAKAAWKFWPDTYGTKARRWPTVKGKDASEARLNGLDLRAWVIAGLFGTEERFERFVIQTIDGGMTDGEALRAMKGET